MENYIRKEGILYCPPQLSMSDSDSSYKIELVEENQSEILSIDYYPVSSAFSSKCFSSLTLKPNSFNRVLVSVD